MSALDGKDDFERRPHLTRYELIDKDGRSICNAYEVGYLVTEANRRWPDQEQDEERAGKGWDVQVVGS